MSKKKLLFVINTLSAGGAETSFLELLRQLDPIHYDIDVFVLTAQGELIDRLPADVHLKNHAYSDSSVLTQAGKRQLMRTVLAAAVRRGTIFVQLPYLVKTFLFMCKRKCIQPDKLLWQLLAKGAPRIYTGYDLAVAYLEGGSAYYVADMVQARKKVAFFHSDYAKSGYTREIDRACYLKFDRIFTVSEEGKRTLLHSYPELEGKLSLYHNPLDIHRIRERSTEAVRQHAWASYDGKKLLSVGRLIPLKAFDVAIDAMKRLKEAGVKARWYVLGEGPERPKLEQLIRQYGLEQDFILVGAVENPFPYYAGCDLYVHVSRYEGRSVAIQEAQALGCPVLASDCSGNREQITDGVNGRLVALDPACIAAQIRELLADPELPERMGKAAAEMSGSHPEDIEKLLSFAE